MNASDNSIEYRKEDIAALLDFPAEYRNFVNTQANYQKLFDKYFARHKSFLESYDSAFEKFAALETGKSASAEAAEPARATAAELIEKEHAKIESERKWNRSVVLSGDAMMFVIFLIPAVGAYNKPSTDALAEAIVEQWNRTFPKSNIKKSDYNTIYSGFRRPGLAGLFGFR